MRHYYLAMTTVGGVAIWYAGAWWLAVFVWAVGAYVWWLLR